MKTATKNEIVIDIGGWVALDPSKVDFVYIGGAGKPEYIKGDEWWELSDDERGDYILEDLVKCIKDADDASWGEIEVNRSVDCL